MLLHVHTDHEDCNLGREAQDRHLDFHTAPELCLCTEVRVQCCFTSTCTRRTIIWDGEPRTATSTLTQHLSVVGSLLPRGGCRFNCLPFTSDKPAGEDGGADNQWGFDRKWGASHPPCFTYPASAAGARAAG